MKEVTCPHCEHKQKTRTKLARVTCSSCGKKFPIENKILNSYVEENKFLPEENLETNINKEELKRVKLD